MAELKELGLKTGLPIKFLSQILKEYIVIKKNSKTWKCAKENNPDLPILCI